MQLNTFIQNSGALSSEVVLWENPNPAAAFGSQVVNLNADREQFKYIGVVVRTSTTDGHMLETLWKQADLANNPGGEVQMSAAGVNAQNTANTIRRFYVIGLSESQFGIVHAQDLAAPQQQSNQYLIPIKIVGYY